MFRRPPLPGLQERYRRAIPTRKEFIRSVNPVPRPESLAELRRRMVQRIGSTVEIRTQAAFVNGLMARKPTMDITYILTRYTSYKDPKNEVLRAFYNHYIDTGETSEALKITWFHELADQNRQAIVLLLGLTGYSKSSIAVEWTCEYDVEIKHAAVKFHVLGNKTFQGNAGLEYIIGESKNEMMAYIGYTRQEAVDTMQGEMQPHDTIIIDEAQKDSGGGADILKGEYETLITAVSRAKKLNVYQCTPSKGDLPQVRVVLKVVIRNDDDFSTLCELYIPDDDGELHCYGLVDVKLKYIRDDPAFQKWLDNNSDANKQKILKAGGASAAGGLPPEKLRYYNKLMDVKLEEFKDDPEAYTFYKDDPVSLAGLVPSITALGANSPKIKSIIKWREKPEAEKCEKSKEKDESKNMHVIPPTDLEICQQELEKMIERVKAENSGTIGDAARGQFLKAGLNLMQDEIIKFNIHEYTMDDLKAISRARNDAIRERFMKEHGPGKVEQFIPIDPGDIFNYPNEKWLQSYVSGADTARDQEIRERNVKIFNAYYDPAKPYDLVKTGTPFTEIAKDKTICGGKKLDTSLPGKIIRGDPGDDDGNPGLLPYMRLKRGHDFEQWFGERMKRVPGIKESIYEGGAKGIADNVLVHDAPIIDVVESKCFDDLDVLDHKPLIKKEYQTAIDKYDELKKDPANANVEIRLAFNIYEYSSRTAYRILLDRDHLPEKVVPRPEQVIEKWDAWGK
jgi:hypothetical protein